MEIRKSTMGTVFTALGVLNLGAVLLSGLLLGGNSAERAQGLVIAISCLSGMLICFAVAAGLHLLCEIAHRLELLQKSLPPPQKSGTGPAAANGPKN